MRVLASLLVLTALGLAAPAAAAPDRQPAGTATGEPARWTHAHDRLPGQAILTERGVSIAPGCLRSVDPAVPSDGAAVLPSRRSSPGVHVSHSTDHLTASPATSLRGPPTASPTPVR